MNNGMPYIVECEKSFEWVISYYEKEAEEPRNFYCMTKEMEELMDEYERTGSMTFEEPWKGHGFTRLVIPKGVFVMQVKKLLENRPWHTHYHFEGEVLLRGSY